MVLSKMNVILISEMRKRKTKYNIWQLAALATAFKRAPETIIRWEKRKDDRLESDKARNILSNLKKMS